MGFSMTPVPMKELAVVMLHSSCKELSPLPVRAEPLQWDAINTTTQWGESMELLSGCRLAKAT